MILFFGTRPGKTENKELDSISCPFCEQTGTLTVSETSNWFHLFWIRIFKISNEIIAECSHCKKVYYKEEFNDAMLRATDEN
ncbi:zinc-ribbon domain-containing protein [uncultured Kriegella sp.]|uniref:zinc-ribbon domain-containing protein n=1 Tax=uncultured Kriegella sp. TaxID=1798910 RepID=UPI0030D853EC|tara:strand:+ start:128341 stop:128586 length:246 start_codon:yes stop_codon:yes gene_type:complete